MPGSERGILGIKKDPKNPLIFTFTKKGEEWPSSDSGDSDYDPGSEDDDNVDKKKAKRAKKQQRKKKAKATKTVLKEEKVHSDEGFASEGSQDNSEDVWGQRIPPEVLLKIFECYVHSHGALPFLSRASQVCKLWHSTSQDPGLWEKLDLSYGWIKSTDNNLIWLCNNRGSRIKELNLQTWKNLTSSALQVCGAITNSVRTKEKQEAVVDIKSCRENPAGPPGTDNNPSVPPSLPH